MTIQAFIHLHGLTMPSAPISQPPSKDWPTGSRHFFVVLLGPNGFMGIAYHMASGLEGDPSIVDVLGCLRMDASDADMDFPDWCGCMGLDDDSVKALRTWEACRKTREDLLRILGPDTFDQLMSCDPE